MNQYIMITTTFDNKDEAKVLFIITAAIDPDAVRILSGCLDDLTNCGIKDENITIYDLHKVIPEEELNKFLCMWWFNRTFSVKNEKNRF